MHCHQQPVDRPHTPSASLPSMGKPGTPFVVLPQPITAENRVPPLSLPKRGASLLPPSESRELQSEATEQPRRETAGWKS